MVIIYLSEKNTKNICDDKYKLIMESLYIDGKDGLPIKNDDVSISITVEFLKLSWIQVCCYSFSGGSIILKDPQFIRMYFEWLSCPDHFILEAH